jgi:hypothetical protein
MRIMAVVIRKDTNQSVKSSNMIWRHTGGNHQKTLLIRSICVNDEQCNEFIIWTKCASSKFVPCCLNRYCNFAVLITHSNCLKFELIYIVEIDLKMSLQTFCHRKHVAVRQIKYIALVYTYFFLTEVRNIPYLIKMYIFLFL